MDSIDWARIRAGLPYAARLTAAIHAEDRSVFPGENARVIGEMSEAAASNPVSLLTGLTTLVFLVGTMLQETVAAARAAGVDLDPAVIIAAAEEQLAAAEARTSSR